MLRKEDGYLLRRLLDFEVEGQWNKERLRRTWEKQVGLRRKMHFANQNGVLA